MSDSFTLDDFLPYQLSVLSNTVSRAISRLYAERFQLSITEWRVIAILAQHPAISAREVAERAAMDKVAVSRAVANLIDADRVRRATAAEDRRRSILTLTDEGRRIHAEVVPAAKASEAALLSILEPEQREQLRDILTQLHSRASALEVTD